LPYPPLKRTLTGLLLLGSLHFGYAQAPAVAAAPGVKLLPDSATSSQLLASLTALLHPPAPAALVLPSASLATAALLEEVGAAAAGAPGPLQQYLTNVVPLDSVHYLLQLATVAAPPAPVPRATYELLAQRQGTAFVFSAPLARNTAGWHRRQLGSYAFYYPTELPRGAAALVKKATFFDHKLQAAPPQTTVYCCPDLPAALHLIGVTSQAGYAGLAHGTLSSRAPRQLLLLTPPQDITGFDPHDLWHQRVRNTLPAGTLNKPVDEGCAYLYGGSWGIAWPTILRLFQAKVGANPNTDWLAVYESAPNFNDSKRQPLLPAYVINALLVQKIEREKGFAAVKPLLACGKYEPGNANYFKALEAATGITKSSFNSAIWALVRASGQ